MTHNPPTSQLDLDAIEARAGAATPGPWTAESSIPYGHRVGSSDEADWVAWTGEHGETGSEADATYIATMHPEVGKALIDEVRRLRAIEAVAIEVRAKHKPRTERHGSGCVQCGIVWPCPTYKALNDAARPAVRPAVETGA